MPRYRAEPTLSDSRTRQKRKKKVSSVMLLACLIYFVEPEPPFTIGAGADPSIIFKGSNFKNKYIILFKYLH